MITASSRNPANITMEISPDTTASWLGIFPGILQRGLAVSSVIVHFVLSHRTLLWVFYLGRSNPFHPPGDFLPYSFIRRRRSGIDLFPIDEKCVRYSPGPEGFAILGPYLLKYHLISERLGSPFGPFISHVLGSAPAVMKNGDCHLSRIRFQGSMLRGPVRGSSIQRKSIIV